MSNVEIAKPTITHSGPITITVGTASGTLSSTTVNQMFAGVSNILGYTITSGANPGTLALAMTSANGFTTMTATTSANVATNDLIIRVYWSNNSAVGILAG